MSTRMLIFACCALPLFAQLASSQTFTAKSVTRTGTIRLKGSLDRVFPLFGPVREKEWAPGWEPHIVAPLTSEVAEGMVFTVEQQHGTMFWIVTRFDPAAHAISYVNVTPGDLVNRILIRCRSLAANETEVSVTYQHTGLAAVGNQYVESQNETAYAAKMRHWEEAINHLLTTGRQIEMRH